MQLTLAAGFVPFSSVLNTVLVLSVVRGRRLYSCGPRRWEDRPPRRHRRRAGRVEGGWLLLLLLGESSAFFVVIS